MKNLEPPIIVKKAGPLLGNSVAIIVGIHGNENGPVLEWNWLNGISIERGTLYLIFANPTAYNQNVRHININLNRRFGKDFHEYPEDESARLIESILDQCDASLDLHMYNEDMEHPFVICNKLSNTVALKIPAEYIINLPEDGLIGGTDDYMFMAGKIGLCVEVGSLFRPNNYRDVIHEVVNNFLGHYSIVTTKPGSITEPKILRQTGLKIIEFSDFRFTKDYKSFDPIIKGEVIASENNQSITAQHDGYILFPRPNNPIGAEAFYLLKDD